MHDAVIEPPIVPVVSAQVNVQAITRLAEQRTRLIQQISRVIIGQQEVIDNVLLTIFCGGHALIVGVPGLAKTLLVRSLARTLDLSFNRIQFTPDLMPSDITGTDIIEEDQSTGRRTWTFVQGPIFANILLADEINRTPPKTQAALLEAMQERQVTVGRVRHPLSDPFFVLATQNPIEQEGTYPLPEAQLDRFFFKLIVNYSGREEMATIIRHGIDRMYGDGGGLWLQVRAPHVRSWIFRYTINGKTRAMGLGATATVPLALARDEAAREEAA
jgi:MoxR-like ATPase